MFRDIICNFLYDSTPKLFKSSTEGNVIVRLMQVSAQPNQTLHRMIYSFTSTAYEIAEATMENYLRYGFYEVGDWATDFGIYETKLGQLQLDFNIYSQLTQQMQVAEGKVLERTPVFAVIEAATVPLKKDSPKRMLIILAYLLIAIAGTTAWVLYKR